MFYYKTFQVMMMMIFSITILALFGNIKNVHAVEDLWFPEVEDIVYDTLIDQDTVKYIYVSGQRVINEKDELQLERDINIRKYKTDDPKVFIKKFYSSPQFIKKNNIWYHLEYATTTKLRFDTETKPIEDIIDQIQSFFYSPFQIIKIANAIDDDIYPYSSAHISVTNANWTTARNSSSGTLNTNNNYLMARKAGADYIISRIFHTYDTSSIGSDSTINSATLFIMPQALTAPGITSRATNIYSSSHTDTVVGDDFDQGGTTVYCDTAIEMNDQTVNIYSEWDFNSSGLSGINKTGYSKFSIREVYKDFDNVAPTDDHYMFYYDDNEGGTSKDPYLNVVYTEATATTSATSTPLSQLVDFNDITLISKFTQWYETSTSTVPYKVSIKVIYIPFVFLFLFLVLSIWIFGRILNEIVIRLKK